MKSLVLTLMLISTLPASAGYRSDGTNRTLCARAGFNSAPEADDVLYRVTETDGALLIETLGAKLETPSSGSFEGEGTLCWGPSAGN